MYKYLILILALLTISVSAEPLQLPNDINGHRYQDSIKYLYINKLASGYDDGTFKPNTTINRAEFVTIMTDMHDSLLEEQENVAWEDSQCIAAWQDPSYLPLSDVQDTNLWYFGAVCRAVSQGWASGYPDGTFKPQQTITVAEASKVIARFFNAELPEGLPWYKPGLDYIREQGAQPATALNVTKPITRGEMAYMIHKMQEPQPIVNPDPTTIPVLVYHHVRQQEGWPKSTWSWKLTVSPNKFNEQLEYLSQNGYTTISMAQLVEILDGATPPPKPVVITFDDNNLNQYTNAFPSLQKYGHNAVFYLITNRLENNNYVNADRAKEMYAAGMDIQSHTHTHSNMTTLSAEQIAFELNESKRILEELLGNSISHVAYPLTAHNEHVRNNVELSGYDTGTVMDPRRATLEVNRFKIPRILITDDTNLSKYLP